MTWPSYSPACRRAVEVLLRKGGSLSAYRANPKFPSWTGPQEGSYAFRLEREIEKRFKVKHAVAVNSGTAALHAAIVSALPKHGREAGEIVVSPFTFSATAAAILLSGYTPVFADVDPYTFCISKETVKRVITKRTRAILPVHLFGGMADVRGIQSLGLPVIEDACQAVGARSGDGYAGTLGLAGSYSFNGGKNVPAGEAGMLVTNDDRVAEQARFLSNHGENFHEKSVGFNYRPNELTACVAYHGLLELEERNQRRRELAGIFGQVRYHSKYINRTFSEEHGGTQGTHAFYVYPFTLHKPGMPRYRFIEACERKGVTISGGYVTPPLHHYKAFQKFARGPLPVVDELSFKTLCLISSFTPDASNAHAEKVSSTVRDVCAQ